MRLDDPVTANGVRVVVGLGRSTMLSTRAGEATAICVLRGRVRVSLEHARWTLDAPITLFLEGGEAVALGGEGVWVYATASHSVVQDLVRDACGRPIGAPPVPGTLRMGPRLRHILRTALRSRRADACETRLLASSVATCLATMQLEYEPLIARCGGRSWKQRRNAFVRLQRARNYLCSNLHRELSIAEAAAIANYSPFHFIRAFEAAYGATPHAYLVEQRLAAARDLLRTSSLAIAEIASMSGFEDRSAFARSYKRHFGITASDHRRLLAAAPIQAVA
ncbi:MAG: helix-turn-helix domain-containing protein [Dokdonella sp.]|uniref:helix-turn-helix domain-containing protein n=1 Tax=Dokdonella sp. TaxID=2291710 RepID=UPI003F7E70AF